MKNSKTWKKTLTAGAPRAWALEARLMFDAAAAHEVVDRLAAGTDTHLQELHAHETAAARDSRADADASAPADTSLPGAAAATPGHELLVVDRDLADLDLLLGGVRAGVEVVLLDPAADPWAQIGQALAERPGTTALHLVTHGNSGEIILGGRAYGVAELQARRDTLEAWRPALAAGADILLYGCDIAAGSGGTRLVDTLAELSGADVAASNDATGGGASGGDWALEYTRGTIETGHFLVDAVAEGYDNRLATVALNGSAGWVPVMFGASRDPQGDSQAGAADTDIIGDATHGSLYTAFSDGGTSGTGDDHLYFRLRIDNPTSTSNFSGVAVVGMDVNGDGRVDLFMSVDGRNNGQAVRLLDPGTGLNNSPNTTSTAPLPSGWLPNNGVYAFSSSNYAVTAVSAATDPNWGASSANPTGGSADNLTGIGGTDVFVSWRVPIADLAAVLAKPSAVDRNGVHGPRGATGFAGFTRDTTVSYVSFTQTQNGPINGDLNGVGANYDKNATFAQLGVYTAPMTAANPVPASTGLALSDNVAGVAASGQDVTFTFTFTENVSGFDASDITVSNGSKGAFTSVDGKTYTLVVTPTPGSSGGEVGVSVASGAATGLSGLPTLAGNAVQAYDTLAPTVTVDTPALALSGRPTLSGSTDLPDGALVTLRIDPDHDSSTLDTVVYQALVSGGVWTLNTATAVPTSGQLPSGGLNASSHVTATATDAAGNSSSAVELSRPTVTSQSTTSTTPTLAGRWTRIDGDSLSVSVNGATYLLAPAGDAWSLDLATAVPSSGSLGPLLAGQTYAVTATVTRGGVAVSDTTSGELLITSTPVVAVGIDGGDAVSDSNTRPTLTGTSSAAGGFVIVRLDPGHDGDLTDAVTYSVTPDGAGNWSLDTATATPISGQVPIGGYVGTVGVRATDSQGVVADTQVLTISTPTVAIGSITSAASSTATALVSNAGGGASYLNMAEDANVTLSGTATGASTVDLRITDANGHTVTVSGVAVSGGSWSATGVNLSGLDNGTLTVDATLGGTAISDSDSSVSHDKVAPYILDTTQSPIRASSGAIIKGTTDLVAGTVLTVRVYTDAARTTLAQTLSATVQADGAWSTATSANLSNNSTAYFTVSAPANSTDAAGNLVQPLLFSRSVQNSIGNSTRSIDLKPISGDNLVSVGEIGSGLSLGGETSVTSATVTVVFSQNGSTLFTKTTTSGATHTAGTNNWSLTLSTSEVQSIANGQFLVTASVLDGSVTLSDAERPTLNLAAPTLQISDDVPGTATGAFTFTFAFSEDVTGFAAGDIVLSAGTAGSFTQVDARTYTLQVTPPATGSGSITATVASGTATGTTTGRSIVGSTASQDYAAPALAAAPTLSIDADALATSRLPILTGTTNLPAGAPVLVTIDPDNDAGTADSLSYSATVQSDGSWSIDTASATPTSGSLPADGLPSHAKVSATATNAYGNSTTAVAHVAPAVTALTTSDPTPTLGGTWTNLAGDTLSVTVDGVSLTPTIVGNTWTLAIGSTLADGTHEVVATSTRGGTGKVDVTSGELVIDTTATVDITGAATVGPVGTATPVIAGTSTGLPAGAVLTLELDTDGNGSHELSYQTTIAADGSWSIATATAIPLSGALPAGGLNGTIAMRASATDALGNTGTDTQTLRVDTTPPAIAWSTGTRSASATPTIRGTTDLPAGSTLTLEIDPDNDGDWSDAQTYTTPVAADGSWSVQTTSALSGTVGTRASGSDAAGNSVQISQPLTIDPSTPTLEVDAVPTANNDGIADTSEDDAITLAGSSTQLPDGTVVTVTLTDGAITITDTASVAGGRWSLLPLNLSGLASGTLRVTATALDAGGVAYSATTAFEHDRSAVVAIDRITQDTGALADFVTTDTDLQIAGTATPGATVAVVLRDSGNTVVASFSVVADAGTGSWTTGQTGTLALGSYTIEATVGGSTATQALRIVGAPTLAASNPADNGSGVAVGSHLTLSFDRNVRAGSGLIVLVDANGGTVESFDVATGLGDQGGSLSFDGSTGLTINPGSDLTASSSYSLAVAATAVIDGDGIAYAGIADTTTLNFSTAGLNTAPVNSVPGAQAVDEDSALDFRSGNGNAISVSDAQDNLASTQLSVGHGSLTVSLAGGASISAGANGSATLTLAGTASQINAALATLSYQGSLDFNGSDTLTVLSTDSAGTPLSDTDTVAITVAAVNDAPVAVAASGSTDENTVLSGVLPMGSDADAPPEIQETGAVDHTVANRTFSFFGDGSAEYGVAIGSGPGGFASIADMAAAFQAHPNYASLPYTVGVNTAGDGLRLSFKQAGDYATRMIERWGDGGVSLSTVRNGQDLTFAVSSPLPSGKGTLTLNADGSYSFDPGSDFDALGAGQSEIVSFQYTVTDPDGQASAPQTVSITVNGRNDAPVLANGATLAYTENDAATVVDAALTLGDVDSATLAGATVTVSAGYVSGQDVLGFTDQNGISGSFDAATGVLSLSGPASLAQYQAALRSVTYRNTSEAPSTSSRTITFQVDDGAALNATSNTLDATVSVAAVNDTPVNSTPTSVSVTEDTPFAFTGSNALSVDDVDGNLASTQLSVTHGTLSVSLAGGATISAGGNGSADLTLSGSQAQINAALATLSYQGSLDFNGSDTLTVLSTDSAGTPLSDSDTVAISVAAVNDAPVHSVPASVSASEDTAFAFTGANALSVDDIDGNLASTRLSVTAGTLGVSLAGGATISAGANGSADLTLSGTQAQINAALATLSYQGSLDFNGSDTLTVLSTDSAGTPLSDTDTVAISVAAVNDAPSGTDSTLTVLSSGSRAFAVANFGMVDPDVGDSLAAVRIDTLPSTGTLAFQGNAVSLGQLIASADLASLVYTPAPGAIDGSSAEFTFSVQDQAGAFDVASNTITLLISTTNNAPVANSDAVTTNEDTPVTIDVLANDTDVEGSTLAIASASVDPSQGTVSIVSGQIVFTPAANFTGTATISYVANDGSIDSAPATVTVTVTPVNDAPVANADAVTTTEDTPVTIDVLANDTDVEGSTLSITSASVDPSQGTVSIVSGQLVFTPATNFTGTATISYVANDGTADSAPATVTVSVTPANDAPVANADAATTAEGTPVTIDVLANDSDVEVSALSITSASVDPSQGTVAIVSGQIVFTPAANFTGTATISYVANDGTADSALATVTVSVTPVNDSPVANADAATTAEDTPVTIDVLANDTDVEGSTLTIASASVDPSQGTVSIVSGQLVFTPATNFTGTATISYVANDGSIDSAPATVTVTVTPVNDAPVANADAATTNEDTPVTIDVLANDTDVEGSTLTIASASVDPSQGTVSIVSGQLVFTPAANFTGTATISYVANDGGTDSAPATVTVTVTPANDAPVANADAATTTEDTPVTIDVLVNDTDVEDSTLTIASASVDPSQGTVSIVSGQLVFTPATNFTGSATISYVANDGTADSAPATVTVSVTPVNDAPVAVADTTITTEDTPVTIDVLANDTDVEGSTLTIASASVDPSQGTVSIVSGQLVFTPAANFTGTATISYVANDGTADSAPATVTVSVTPVNDAPVANADAATTAEDTPVTIDVLVNDTDVEGSALTITSASVDPSQGSVSIVSGQLVFTPATNFTGTATISYVANDGTADSAPATVTVTVTPVNDAPVANFDAATTTEDTPVTIDVLANDTDVEGSTLTIASASVDPSQGTVAIVSGQLVFTPAANFTGIATISYVANDGTADSALATVTVSVTPVNDSPVANADAATTAEDTPVTIDVLANDSDVEGSALTITSASVDPSQGSVSIVGGQLVFTPAANFTGTATISYVANDGTADSAPATVTVTVTPVNDAPVANANAATTNEDTPVTIDVLANDTDVEGSTLTIASASVDPSQGTVSIVSGQIVFTPAANFTGTATISYVANDGSIDSAPATVTVTVTPVNDAPVANADAVTTTEDTPVTIDVLANDTDVEGSTLSITSASVDPSQGTVSIVSGQLVFTPATNFTGTATISYVANDGTADSAPATVTVSVTPANDAPVANADAATTAEGTPVTIDVLANDSDVEVSALSITSASVDPSQGTVAIVSGQIVFTPAANFTGTATISYVANDGGTDSSPATVTVTVTPANDSPVANADAMTTTEDTPVTIDVLANDTDVEGSTLTIASASVDPSQGSVSIVSGQLVFTPAANFNGTATISYVANDGTADSAPATVTVSVTPANDAPVANADAATTAEDTPVTIDVLANDTDVEGSTLTIASASVDPSQGSVSIVGGQLVFTPATNFTGTATISYVAIDGSIDSAPATVTVSVTPANDAPVANADAATTAEDTPVTIDVLANDSDVEGSALSITSASVDPSQGSVSIVVGQLVFTPAANFTGTATISYVANDGTADSAPATVTVSVTPVNDAPVANADAVTTTEDTPVTIDVLANDTDVEGSTLAIASASVDPSQGSVAVVNGQLVFTPAANFTGTATISYVANDGTADSAPATVSVTVTLANDAPVANADAVTMTEDTPVTIDVLANDSDVEGSTLTIASATVDPSQGSVSIVSGQLVFTPATNFTGTSTISYVANDGTADSAPTTVTVSVTPVNDAPVANADAATTTEDTPVTIDVLANDTDVEGSTLSITSATVDPSQGSVSIVSGQLVFTPATNFTGTSTISYVANDGTADSAPATVTVSVTPVNDAPVANADAVTTTEDTPVTIDVLTNDTDVEGSALTIASATVDPSQGSVSIVSGQLVFTPATNFTGTATISYVANDGGTDSAPATVSVTVTPANDAPVANADAATTTEDTPVTIDVLANDSDIEGSTLSITSATVDPSQGTVSIVNGQLVFTPAANFTGSATISYVANDGTADSAPATVTVSVTPMNDAPVANADVATTAEDTPVTIDVLANDSDVEGSALSITSESVDPSQGTVSIVSGQLVFTPAANFTGTATISYVVNDGTADSAPATVTVTVTPVNDAPTWPADAAAQAAATTAQDTPVSARVPAATDVEPGTLIYAKGGNPAHGTLTVEADGRYVYVPAAGFHGSDHFVVRVRDAQGGEAALPVEVQVWPAPSLQLAAGSDLGVSDSDRITPADEITLAGLAEAGQMLRIYGPQGELLGEVRADELGRWTLAGVAIARLQGDDPAAPAGAAGAYSFSARLLLPSGAESAATRLTVRREIAPPPVAEAVTPPPTPAASDAAPAEAAPVASAAAESPAFDSALRLVPGAGAEGGTPPALPPRAEAAGGDNAPIHGAGARSSADGDIYTRPSGFQIMVAPSNEPSLKLYRGIDDQIVPMNRLLVLQVPADAFVHTVLTETVTLVATLADGRPLPAWLSFDGRSGKLVGEPPASLSQDLAIRITARDSQGREATTVFRVKVSDAATLRPGARASFSQQLARGEALSLQPGQRQWQLTGRGLPIRRI